MQLLYICFVDFENMTDASAIRPYKMYTAFKELGWDIYLVATSQSRANKQNRQKAITDAIKYINTHKIDFCYIESPTTAIKYSNDYALLKLLAKKKIPTAYFYRDFYLNFNDVQQKAHNVFEYLYYIYIQYLTNKTNKALKNCDIIYFPSYECFEHFQFKNMKSLPPAGMRCIERVNVWNNNSLYIGGLSKRYGTDLLIKAFEILNSEANYPLTIVCRKEDLYSYGLQSNLPWLNIIHANVHELQDIYNAHTLAILPLEHTPYNNLAIPVKLMEYMSFGKAIVCTKNTAMNKFIEKHNCGIICNNTAHDLASAVKQMFANKEQLQQYANNAYEAVQNAENWKARALQIQRDLLKNE